MGLKAVAIVLAASAGLAACQTPFSNSSTTNGAIIGGATGAGFDGMTAPGSIRGTVLAGGALMMVPPGERVAGGGTVPPRVPGVTIGLRKGELGITAPGAGAVGITGVV